MNNIKSSILFPTQLAINQLENNIHKYQVMLDVLVVSQRGKDLPIELATKNNDDKNNNSN